MPGDDLAETAASDSAPAVTRAPGEAPRPGDTVGRYVIERVLGAGGMGVVYAAHDPDLDRRVALKLLHASDGLGAGPEARTRLLREARAMAKVSHVNVITVYEVGTAGGVDFVAMELVEGTNVADWLRSTRRPQPEILRVFRAAGRGLAAAHAMGLVHRDFKPANVLVGGNGKVVVTDFGLARAFDGPDAALAATVPVSAASSLSTAPTLPVPVDPAQRAAAALDETMEAAATPAPSASTGSGRRPLRGDSADLSSTITRTGTLLGTPAYMAPEQLRGEATTGPRADQYAFAVALWEGLAGARPYRGATFDELKHAALHGDAADADRIPRRLRAVLARGLARDPDKRWRDVDDLLAALDRADRRPRAGVFAATALAVALLAAGIFLATRGDRGGNQGAATVDLVGRCGLTDQDLASTWSPAVAAKIDAHFGADPSWAETKAAIDRHVEAWQRERRDTCEHTAAREYHGRVACMLSVRDELAAVTQLLPTIPVEALRGGSITEILSAPDSCRTGANAARPALPEDPRVLAELSAIQRDSAIARIAARGGKPEEARAMATANVKRARELGDQLAIAVALEAAGTVEHVLGSCETAEPFYSEAATAAESANAGGLRAMSKIGHLECFMRRSSDIVKIRTLAQEAEAAVKGAGNDRSLMATLDMNLADIDYMVGDVDRAIDRTAAARAVFVELHDARRVAVAARSEAILRRTRDRGDDEKLALELTRQALVSNEAAFGPDHPQTRGTRRALAFALLGINPAEARSLFEQNIAADAAAEAANPRQRWSQTFEVRGRVVMPDGSPAEAARVFVGGFFLASDDGVPLTVEFGEDAPASMVTGPDGRFVLRGPHEAIAMAARGDLLSEVVDARGEVVLHLGPTIRASGKVAIVHDTPPADAERAVQQAARVARPGAVALGGREAVSYQVFARTDDDGNWSIERLPAAMKLRVGLGTMTALGDKLVASRPLVKGPDGAGHLDLTEDLHGVTLDLIVRADTAAVIPSAQVVIFHQKVARPPTSGATLRNAMGETPRWSTTTTVPVVDENHTRAGEALYQPGDIHARVAAVPPGKVTACVIALAGDIADPIFMRTLAGGEDIDVRCSTIEVKPAPMAQAFVLVTPPMRRLKPR